jgi:hypothetical protein
MRNASWLIITIAGIVLIVVHGFWNDLFVVGYLTIIILLILSIPFLSHFLKRAKVAGAEFEFRDEIENTKKIVKQSVEKSKSKNNGKSKPLPFETFNLHTVRRLLESDPILALASLRIEIEKKLRLATKFFKLPSKKNSLSQIIDSLMEREILSSEQISALRKIIEMCNKAIHGYEISKDEVREIVDLTEELNKSFSIGYSISFYPNDNFEKQGLVCPWEHCIEFMPLLMRQTSASCPIFGHNCPGGTDQVSVCKKSAK